MRLVEPAGPNTGDVEIWLGAKDTLTFTGLWLKTPKTTTEKKTQAKQKSLAYFDPQFTKDFPSWCPHPLSEARCVVKVVGMGGLAVSHWWISPLIASSGD